MENAGAPDMQLLKPNGTLFDYRPGAVVWMVGGEEYTRGVYRGGVFYWPNGHSLSVSMESCTP
jgi:hypothetical protein